jgi:hypothetical protein
MLNVEKKEKGKKRLCRQIRTSIKELQFGAQLKPRKGTKLRGAEGGGENARPENAVWKSASQASQEMGSRERVSTNQAREIETAGLGLKVL